MVRHERRKVVSLWMILRRRRRVSVMYVWPRRK